MADHKNTSSQLLHLDRKKNIEHGALHQPTHNSIAYGFKHSKDLAHVFQNKLKGYAYGRASNPTVSALEDKISLLEDAIATCCFATGMAAIAATMLSLLRAGDHFISSSFIFGNTNSLFNTFAELGIEVTFVDATDVNNIDAAKQKNTKAVFVETIANPRTQISDLENIGNYCEQHKLLYIVDNTMTTPALFKPKAVKAGLVINSLSKYIAGHGNALGGSVSDCGYYDWNQFSNIYDIYKKKDSQLWGILQIRKKGLRDMGGSLSAEVAHHIAVGAETLSLRINQSSQNALQLAEYLSKQDKINKVYFPGLTDHPQHKLASRLFLGYSSLVSIELDESIDCFEFLDQLKFVVVATNLGDNRTLALPVAHTIYYEMGIKRRQSMGIAEGLIRLSIGIEDYADLQADFEQAFASFN